MTTHTPTIGTGHDQPPLPNQPFSSWLRGQTTLFVSQILAVLGFISSLAAMLYYVSHDSEKRDLLTLDNVRLAVDYAHIGFMALFSLALIQVLDDNERGSYRVKLVYKRVFEPDQSKFKLGEVNFEKTLKKSKEQLKKFKRRFLWFWIGMLCLYVFFACQHSYQMAISAPLGQPVLNAEAPVLFTNKSPEAKKKSGTDVIFSSIAETKPPDSNAESPLKSESYPWSSLALSFFVFLFNNLTLLSIFWCFLVMYIPLDEMKKEEMEQKERRYQYSSVLIVGGLIILFPVLAFIKWLCSMPGNWEAYVAVFDALSGVINAIVLALLIARLDSKLVGLPSWLICILYSYAAIQPLFFVFELNRPEALQKIAVFVLIFVFMSKIYFFLIIIYALQTGKMLNYLFCFPILRQRASDPNPPKPLSVDESDATQTHPASDKLILTEDWVMRLFDYCDQRLCERLRREGKRRIRRVRELLSRGMKNERSLAISKWLGLGALCAFFILLLVSSMMLSSANSESSWWNNIHEVIDRSRSLAAFGKIPSKWNAIFKVAIDSAQLLAVSATIVALYLVRKKNDYTHKVTDKAWHIFQENFESRYRPDKDRKQVEKFKEYFLFFWCATFFLYVAFLLHDLGLNFTSGEVGTTKYLVEILLYPFLEFSLSSLNMLFIFWCFVVLHTPASSDRAIKRQRLLINYSSFVMLLLIAVFLLLFFALRGQVLTMSQMEYANIYATVFDGVIGTLSAIALSLLIARMDSKLFGLPWWSVWVLFAYASIQPLFVAFALEIPILEEVRTLVLAAAFGLKICFFLIIAHSLQSGKVLNYLICFPFLRDRVDSIFENQFEIKLAQGRDHLFTFSILKKNKLYYSTAIRYESREGCDDLVTYLRERMKERDAYLPLPKEDKAYSNKEAAGTYWVEVRADEGDLICESIPLRSEDEAEELIRESREKIPYCKYNRI